MACNIQYNNNGTVKEVRANDGSPSILFNNLKQQFPEQQALDLYLASQSDSFQIYQNRDFNKISVSNTDLTIDKKLVNGLLSYTPYIKGRRIGSFRVKGDRVDQVTIYQNFRGKGYATSLYKYVAKDLIKQGIVLKSDLNMTQDARNVWDSLVEEGVAIKLPDNTYQFTLEQTYPNGEPTIQSVLSFTQEQNKTDRILTKEEIEQVNNLQMSTEDLKSTLNRIFYDKQGFFVFSPQKMSEFYSRAEIKRIQNSPTIQNQIKETVEALNNTEDVYEAPTTHPQEQLELSTTISSFGKILYLNPNKVRQDVLEQTAGTTREEYEDIISTLDLKEVPTTLEESTEQYSSAEILVEVDGEVKSPNYEDRLLTSVNLDKVSTELVLALNSITSRTEQALINRPEDTNRLLRIIEKESAKIGLDVIGIRGVDIGESLRVVTNLKSLIESPTRERVTTLSETLNEVFPDNIKRRTAVQQPKNRNYVYLKTRLSEVEAYNQSNLLKVGTNTYFKVNDKPLETLYEIGQQYNRELTPENVQRTAIQEYGGQEIETAQKLVLLREIFGATRPAQEVQEINETTASNLPNNFIVDFQAKILNHKLRNTPEYQMFYSNFEVDEQGGLSLKYSDDITLATIDRLADEGLRKYSLIDRDFPTLTQTTVEEDNPNTESIRRDFFVNNPQEAPLISTPTKIIDNNTIEVKSTTQDFLRDNNNNLWENVLQDSGRAVFKRLNTNSLSRFNTYNTPHPDNYNSPLQQAPREDNLKNKVNKQLKSEEFEC
jgi:antitoxin component of MazEF toxin-antitoxin module